MSNGYFYADEASQFSFFRIPKLLITSLRFKSVSTEAKLLYGLLLDRMELSTKNGWLDDLNRVFIYYTIESISEDLSCGRDKAMKMLAELEQVELIERARQGRGKPSRIYVKRFTENVSESKKSKKSTSKSRKSRLQEVGNSDPNKTDNNKTEKNETEKSIYPSSRIDAIDQLKQQLNYRYLSEQYPYDGINQLIDLMADAVCSTAIYIKIGGDKIPKPDVVRRFAGLDYSHIEYVIESLHKSNTPIKNMKSYLLTALYNAPLTIGQYYYAAANEAARGVKQNEREKQIW